MIVSAIFAEGEAKGEARGRIEGERKAKAATVRRLLTRRFGLLPAWAERRIESAAIERLDTWLDGILDTPDLEDLLGLAAD
jgi:predicted transposase YdaD